MKYSRKFLDYLERKLDIFQVIKDEFVDIEFKRSGRDFVAICPFHKERKPSFRVHKYRFYHCFGCGEGGDIFTFIMEKRGLIFTDAVKYLIKRYKMAGCK